MLNLVQSASDNFSRANESPLANPPWALSLSVSQESLAVVSDVCEVTGGSGSTGAETYTGTTLPANQYVSATIGAVAFFGAIFLYARVPSGVPHSCYQLLVENEGAGFSVFQLRSLDSGGAATTILSNSSITVSAGDVWTLACVGSTLFVIRNGTILGSVVDTTYSSGQYGGLGVAYASTPSDTTVTLYSIGTASVSDSISGNAGVAGATVAYSGPSSGSVTADGSGNYSITGLSSGAYVITPSLGGYVFSPTSRTETIVASDITGVNFTASAQYSISGNTDSSFTTVTWSGTSSGSTTSDASGYYTIPSLGNGTYTVTPTKAMVTFTPTSQNVTLSGSSASNVNFTSNAPPVSGGTGWLTVNVHDSLRHRA